MISSLFKINCFKIAKIFNVLILNYYYVFANGLLADC